MFKPDGRTAAEKGMGKAHIKARREWAQLVAAGGVCCCRCGRPVQDTKVPRVQGGKVRLVSTWHLDHNRDRTGYLGVAHAQCNVVAGAREGARRVNAKPKTVRRRRTPQRRGVFGPLSS